jgi:hypothetical protein
MTTTLDSLLTEVSAALGDYYDFPAQFDEHAMHPLDTHQEARVAQADRARAAVDAALRAGLDARQVSVRLRMPGHLIVQLISDPVARGTAWTEEIHHLERQASLVRRMRGADVARRVDGNEEKKVALAAEFAVSRPTIDKWIADSREGWESVAPSALDRNR